MIANAIGLIEDTYILIMFIVVQMFNISTFIILPVKYAYAFLLNNGLNNFDFSPVYFIFCYMLLNLILIAQLSRPRNA